MLLALVVLQVFVVLFLLLLVLMQQGGGDGVANLASSGGMYSGKSSSSFVTKVIIVTGTIFMLNSLAIARLTYDQAVHSKSLLQSIAEQEVSNSGATDNLKSSEKQ